MSRAMAAREAPPASARGPSTRTGAPRWRARKPSRRAGIASRERGGLDSTHRPIIRGFMSAELRRQIEARRRIYLLRHGEVSYFDGAGKPFPPPSVALNEEGIAQAEAAAAVLRAVPIDRAVHSDLPRTRETAEIVLRGRGIAAAPCAALREINPGGLMKEVRGPELEAAFTGAFGKSLSRASRFLGGE